MYKKIRNFLSSPAFFWLILAAFVVQAVWIAVSGRYPMAFDEDFHLGIAKLYSHQLSPFFSHQPDNASAYGAVVRDPSYLYHYLLSFPYRWLARITNNEPAQIIALRLINVALFGYGIYVYRKVLTRFPMSAALRNLVLFFFVMTPAVPLLAAQINYDNLLFPMTGLLMLFCLRFIDQVRTTRRLPYGITVGIIVLATLGSIVKYAYIPYALAIVLLCVFALYRNSGTGKFKTRWRRIGVMCRKAFVGYPRFILYSLIIVASLGLFAERYAINLVKYHNPLPDCQKVLSVEECLSYGPWARNYTFKASRVKPGVVDLATFPAVWVHRSITELNFAISSNFTSDGKTILYYGAPPLPLMNVLSWSVLLAGVVLVIRYGRRLMGFEVIRITALASAIYLVALFALNASDFYRVGTPVAIHGRYLFPVMLFLYAYGAIAFSYALKNHQNFKLALVGLAAVMAITSGGAMPFIIRSDARWFWPQSPAIRHINYDLQQWFKPFVVENMRPSTYPGQLPRE